MDVLVISGGSSRQRFDERPVTCREIDETSREELLAAHPETVAPAVDLYTGREHERVKGAVAALRGCADVDWKILSAGFGLVDDSTDLVGYDCAFSDIDVLRARAERLGLSPAELTRAETRQAVSRELGIPEQLRQALTAGYDLALLSLPTDHLSAVAPALDPIPAGTTAIAIAAESAADSVGDCYWLPATETERTLLGSNWVDLRGHLLSRIARSLDGEADLEAVRERPALAYFRGLGMA